MKDIPEDVLECIRQYKDLQAISKKWREAMGFEPDEVNIFQKAWEMLEANLRNVAARHGDDAKWLDWYVWENDAGAKKMQVHDPECVEFSSGREIDSPEKLWAIMSVNSTKKTNRRNK